VDNAYEPRTQKGLFGNLALWVLGILALIIVLLLILWGVGWVAAPWQGKLQARQQIQSGPFRIQAYNHFFDLCASVQTMEQALQQTLVAERTDKGSDLSRDRINFTAQLNDRNDAANQYNADSHKGYTVGQFKAASLPYAVGVYQKGRVTSCGA
jgi:nitrate/nitrite-specific signal transduction histidine kinase